MNILIIKTGHTETFAPNPSSSHIISFGDVLRTTPLLHLFKSDMVHWLTSDEAIPLLENNPYITKLMTTSQDLNRSYDLILNLEHRPIPENTSASKYLGFESSNILITINYRINLSEWLNLPATQQMNWSEKLFFIMGQSWKNEPYLLFPKTEISSTYDLGLNWKIGAKWPEKSWPLVYWEELHFRLKHTLSVSWQEGANNLWDYIAWIQSCNILLTHDSLGMHLGLVLGKKIVALFGPTRHEDIPLNNAIIICRKGTSAQLPTSCYQDLFNSKIFYIEDFEIDLIETQVKSYLKENNEHFAVGWK